VVEGAVDDPVECGVGFGCRGFDHRVSIEGEEDGRGLARVNADQEQGQAKAKYRGPSLRSG
jgi:hypothetical protein